MDINGQNMQPTRPTVANLNKLPKESKIAEPVLSHFMIILRNPFSIAQYSNVKGQFERMITADVFRN